MQIPKEEIHRYVSGKYAQYSNKQKFNGKDQGIKIKLKYRVDIAEPSSTSLNFLIKVARAVQDSREVKF